MKAEDIYQLYKKSKGISTDTRNIPKGSIFFALKGENFNGNKFAQKALDEGAMFSVIDNEEYYSSDKTILVSNALETLQEIARLHRRSLKTTIIAITGSNGKTTTKELVYAILKTTYKTTATIGNLNNHIGVPITLLSIAENTEIGIVEMGANHQKEIELLASIAEPNLGYITNFGKAHLEGFGGVEGVIKGKTELYHYLLENNRKILINTEDSIQNKYATTPNTITFSNLTSLIHVDPFLSIRYKNSTIQTNLIGAYNQNNINAAIAIAEHFKVPEKEIKQALENYIPSNNRSQMIEIGTSKIILDAYNANPTSMRAALSNFSRITTNSDKIVLLGDMFELGAKSIEEHQNIIDYAESLNFEKIYLIGKNFEKTSSSKSSKYSSVENFTNSVALEPATYLIKGSRGMSLEKTLELFN